jgi:pimeloyl-ACP methyl ester carboxylesterase
MSPLLRTTAPDLERGAFARTPLWRIAGRQLPLAAERLNNSREVRMLARTSKAPNVGVQPSPYHPYDIEEDPDAFGLASVSAETVFGNMNLLRAARQSSDTANVFFHGANSRWTTWTPLLTAARTQGRLPTDLVIPDLPGFGQSESLADHLNTGIAGDELWRVISGLGYRRMRLVGHSMGGFLAMDMASRMADRIASLHLVAGSYFTVLNVYQRPLTSLMRTPIAAILCGTQHLLARRADGASALKALERRGLLAPVLWPVVAHPSRLRKGVRNAFFTESRGRSFLLGEQNCYDYDAKTIWSRITVPTFAVFGRADRLVPLRDMRTLMAVLPDASITVLDDAGHLVHIERPHETLKALRL